MPTEKRVKWGAYLNFSEHKNALRLLDYLWKNRVINEKSMYAVAKYLISWGVDMMDKEIENTEIIEKKVSEEVILH